MWQDDLQTCPYNKSHQVVKSRMPYHLIKCKKNYPHLQLEICPFDASHYIPKLSFQNHLKSCPNRQVIEKYKYLTLSEYDHGDIRPAPFHYPELVTFKENWDDEARDICDDTDESLFSENDHSQAAIEQMPSKLGNTGREWSLSEVRKETESITSFKHKERDYSETTNERNSDYVIHRSSQLSNHQSSETLKVHSRPSLGRGSLLRELAARNNKRVGGLCVNWEDESNLSSY